MNYRTTWLANALALTSDATTRLVVYEFARIADDAGLVTQTLTAVATQCHLNPRTVRRAWAKLDELELVDLERRGRFYLTPPIEAHEMHEAHEVDSVSGSQVREVYEVDSVSGSRTSDTPAPRAPAELLYKDSTPTPKGVVAECTMRPSGPPPSQNPVKSPPHGNDSTSESLSYRDVMNEPDFEVFVDKLGRIHNVDLAPPQVGALALRVLDDLGDEDGRRYLSERFAELQGETTRRNLVNWAMADAANWLKRRDAKTKALEDAAKPVLKHQASKEILFQDPEFAALFGLEPTPKPE